MKRVATLQRRVLLLFGCVLAGGLVGAIGQHLSGSSAWFLAVPAFLAVARLYVADPTECLPREKRPSDARHR